MTRRRVLRVGALILLVAVVLALAGATVQGVLTALERRRFERPGRMVDVGEHQLHVRCAGSGRPRVLLEAPLGSLSAHWQPVQGALAAHLGVCSYDRSGLGWSERGDGAFSLDAAVRDLGAVLDQVDATRPVVLVGEGFGAALVATFARHHPEQVAALVLIAPPNPSVRPSTRSPWLARIGVLRALDWLKPPTSPRDETADVVRSFNYRPDHLTQSAAELDAWDALVDSEDIRLPGQAPVLRLGVPPNMRRDADTMARAILDVAR